MLHLEGVWQADHQTADQGEQRAAPFVFVGPPM